MRDLKNLTDKATRALLESINNRIDLGLPLNPYEISFLNKVAERMKEADKAESRKKSLEDVPNSDLVQLAKRLRLN